MQRTVESGIQRGTTRLEESLFGETGERTKRKFYIALTCVVVAVCAFIGSIVPIAFPLDDAYITLHNADVLHLGTDQNYVGSPALAGATSYVHLAVVAEMAWFLSPLVASFSAASLAILIYALGLARLAFRLGGTPFLAAATVAIGVFSGYAPYHLLNGLETGLALATITWAVVFALEEKPTWHLPILCGLMPFIRPELIVFSGLLMARQAWVMIRFRAGYLWVVRDIAVAILAATPWLIWAKWDTGQFVPITVSAKSFYFAEGRLPIDIKIAMVLGALTFMTIVTACLGFFVMPRNTLGLVAFVFLLVFLAAYYTKLPGALHHNNYRYIQIFLPLSILMMLLSAKEKRLARYLIIFSACWIFATLPRAIDTYIDGTHHARKELAGLASWAQQNLPLDSRLLIHDAGYLAYATPFHLFDMVGLKTPASIPFHQAITGPSNGAKRGDAIHKIATQFRPTHAVILDDDNLFWGKTEGYLRENGWKLDKLRPATKVGNYAVFKLTPPS